MQPLADRLRPGWPPPHKQGNEGWDLPEARRRANLSVEIRVAGRCGPEKAAEPPKFGLATAGWQLADNPPHVAGVGWCRAPPARHTLPRSVILNRRYLESSKCVGVVTLIKADMHERIARMTSSEHRIMVP